MNYDHFLEAIRYSLWYRLKTQKVTKEKLVIFMAKDEVVRELAEIMREKQPGLSHEQSMQMLSDTAQDILETRVVHRNADKIGFAFLVPCAMLLSLSFIRDMSVPIVLRMPVELCVLLIGIALMLYLTWMPRHSALKKVCKRGWHGQKTIDELMKVKAAPMKEIIRQYHIRFLAILAAAAALFCVTSNITTALSRNSTDDFQKEMFAVMRMEEFPGELFAVYDSDEACFLQGYLPEGKEAAEASEVRYLFILTKGKELLSSNSKKVSLYRHLVHIELQDLRTGEIVATETVYGGTPDEPFGSRAEQQTNVYGSHPRSGEIKERMEKMVRRQEWKNDQ